MKNTLLFLALFACFASKAQTFDNEIVNVSNKRALAEYEIVVSPNPSNGSINVNAPFGAECKVVSSKGTYIGTWKVEENGFHLADLAIGSYLVMITLDGQTATRKFLVL